jgi:hypothetical protein
MNYPILNQAKAYIGCFFSRIQNRLVPTGSAATGLIVGTALPWIVDHYFREKQKGGGSPIFTPLQNRIQALSFVNNLIWASVGLGALASWGVTGQLYTSVSIVFSSLAVGFTLGTKILLSRAPFSYAKVDDLIQTVISKFDHTVSFDGETCDQLNLSDYLYALRFLNSTDLRKFIEKMPMQRPVLTFHNCNLTDADVERFAEAGWFNRFSSVNLSFNPKLTNESIKWIAQNSTPDKKLDRLNLSKTGITDDGLRQLTEFDKFNNLCKLIIRHNPQITGRGLAFLGKCNSLKLRTLDIGGNPQLLSNQELEIWIEEKGFDSLIALGLCCTNMTTAIFEKMIDQAPWFKRLKGLDVRFNVKLYFSATLSTKLSGMPNIGKCNENGRFHHDYLTYNRGIFCRSCCFRPVTPEFQAFAKQGKSDFFSHLMDGWDLEINEDRKKI